MVRARTAVVMTLVALLVAALLNADDLSRRANRMTYGWQRTVAVTTTSWLRTVSHDSLLDRPRAALDDVIGSQPDRTPSRSSAAAPALPVHPRRPTAAAPLRLYIAGDSVVQALGESLLRLSGATNVVDATLEYRYATGLTRPDYFDWPGRLQERLTAPRHPEVVVVMFGANDLQTIKTATGYARVGSPAWLAEYRKRVAATMHLLTGKGADVYWVGQPVMRDPDLSRRMAQLDTIFRTEAAATPGITYVDTWAMFTDASGRYTPYLTIGGAPVPVRVDDGVHLTQAGGDLVAKRLLALISRRWPLAGH